MQSSWVRGIAYLMPAVLLFFVPIFIFVLLVPLAQKYEQTAVSASLPSLVEVGSREADFKQSVELTITLNPAALMRTNTAGRLTAMYVKLADPITNGTKMFDVDGLPIFAMTESPPLYRDLEQGMSGSDVSALQRFLVTLGLLDISDASGTFGSRTANAVCAFHKKNQLDCSSVFSLSRVAFVPAGSQNIGKVMASVGDILTVGEPVFYGDPIPVAASFKSTAENGNLTAFKNEEVIASASDGSEIMISAINKIEGENLQQLSKFLQTAMLNGAITNTSTSASKDSTASSSVTYTGMTVRKKNATTVATAPGTSILGSQTGTACVIAVRRSQPQGSSTPGATEYEAITVESVSPAVGQLGQVFLDSKLVGRTILRDPTSAGPDVVSQCM